MNDTDKKKITDNVTWLLAEETRLKEAKHKMMREVVTHFESALNRCQELSEKILTRFRAQAVALALSAEDCPVWCRRNLRHSYTMRFRPDGRGLEVFWDHPSLWHPRYEVSLLWDQFSLEGDLDLSNGTKPETDTGDSESR